MPPASMPQRATGVQLYMLRRRLRMRPHHVIFCFIISDIDIAFYKNMR